MSSVYWLLHNNQQQGKKLEQTDLRVERESERNEIWPSISTMGFTTLIFSNAMFFEERKRVSERDKEGLVMYENVRRRDEPAAEDSFYSDNRQSLFCRALLNLIRQVHIICLSTKKNKSIYYFTFLPIYSLFITHCHSVLHLIMYAFFLPSK